MKRTLLAVATVLALAGAMLLPMGRTVSASGPPEPHPEIRQALAHLRQAKGALEKAAHDFKGHRAAALEHTNAAIAECEQALNVDKK